MRELESASFDAIVTDPPYGLEFMGEDWDAPWKHGFSEHGAKDGLVAPRADSTRNPVCRSCRKMRRGEDRCRCDEPDFDERPADVARAFQAWCGTWAGDAMRVLKPGGYLLAFGGTRMYHRLTCALEDAGFELRDSLEWLYGSGFPKSLDVAKAIDAKLGGEGEWRQEDHPGRPGERKKRGSNIGQTDHATEENPLGLRHVYVPATAAARSWQGWGTALKPAHEPIVVARKPIRGTVAENFLEHGVGGIHVAATRLGTNAGWSYPNGRGGQGWHGVDGLAKNLDEPMEATDGRWPANVILSHLPECEVIGEVEVASDGHWPGARPGSAAVAGPVGHAGQDGLDERASRGEVVEVFECAAGCPVAELDAQTGVLKAGGGLTGTEPSSPFGGPVYGEMGRRTWTGYGDRGGASRFFYCAKTTRAERDAGLGDEFEKRPLHWSSGDANPGSFQADGTEKEARNDHPTVKPIEVMRWLLRLVTPPGGRALDLFAGSGSTVCAGAVEGIEVVGIEKDERYAEIAVARAAWWTEHGPAGFELCRTIDAGKRRRAKVEKAGQLDLLAGA